MNSADVSLKESIVEELDIFFQMGNEDDNSPFIIPYSIEKYRQIFSQPEVIFLTIYYQDMIFGFLILLLDKDNKSIELRRIVVTDKGRGIGQQAISKLHIFCKAMLGITRVWLDVFEFNARARFVYEKFGYKQFKSELYEGKTLLFYEKFL